MRSPLPVITEWPQRVFEEAMFDPGVPGLGVRDLEARLVANMAHQVHQAGGQFAAWPKVTITEDDWNNKIRVETWVIPR